MDVSAVYKGTSLGKVKGKKGKSKGKGKAKHKNKEKDPAANPDVSCDFCHWKGRRKRDCRSFEKDKDKKGVNAVEQAPGLTSWAVAAPSGTPTRVSMIELDD